MSAIQRWYFEMQDEAYTYKDGIDCYVHPDDQWCKAGDVEELEQLLAEYLDTIESLRDEKREIMRTWSTACQERETLRTELQQALNHVESLDAERTEIIRVCRHEMGG